METKIQFTGINAKGTAKIKQIGKKNFVLDFDGEYNITENEGPPCSEYHSHLTMGWIEGSSFESVKDKLKERLFKENGVEVEISDFKPEINDPFSETCL